MDRLPKSSLFFQLRHARRHSPGTGFGLLGFRDVFQPFAPAARSQCFPPRLSRFAPAQCLAKIIGCCEFITGSSWSFFHHHFSRSFPLKHPFMLLPETIKCANHPFGKPAQPTQLLLSSVPSRLCVSRPFFVSCFRRLLSTSICVHLWF
jgi:hypothetical protein